MRRRSWYYLAMLLFLQLWLAGYFMLGNSLASDQAPYAIAAFVIYATLSLSVVLTARGKPDKYFVALCHSLPSRGLSGGLLVWVPSMTYVMIYKKMHGVQPQGYIMDAALLTGAAVFLCGIAMIYQYIIYGVTWLMDRMHILKD